MHKQSVEIWHQFYLHHTGTKYIYSGKDMLHLKQLISKVKKKCSERNIDTSEENVLHSFAGFLASIKDKWILDHLEISIVNSKFNSIYAAATKNIFTNDRLDDLVSRRFSDRKSA